MPAKQLWKTKEHVTYEQALERMREKMPRDGIVPLSLIANIIWPGHTMKAQGAAISASKFVRRAIDDGLVRYTDNDHDNYGYQWCGRDKGARK